MLTTEILIRKGYFPVELIPPFNTEELADNLNEITNNFEDFSERSSRSCLHTIPQNKYMRRSLGIPNPLHQIKLSKAIVDNWEQIKDLYSDSNLSLSTPIYNEDSDRALSRAYNFSRVHVEKALRSVDARYYLCTDISRYYSTIYTHSIPWAIHGKSVAKQNYSNSLYGNKIDEYVRNTTDKQTLGIPIGPDTSLVISEIVGTAMDLMIQEEFDSVRGLRYIDDYFLYFSNLSEAEYALSKMHDIMSHFELQLNSEKTKIVELPEQIKELWVIELSSFNFGSNFKEQRTDIINYFSKAFEYSKQHPDKDVLKYAISRIKRIKIHSNNWELYEALVLKSIIVEPRVLSVATRIFLAYKNKEYNLNLEKIADTISETIIHHSKFNHGYEITWALWLSKSLDININEKAAKELSNVDDPLVAITALNLYHNGLIPKGLNCDYWNSLMKDEELYDIYWILAYEAEIKGWIEKESYLESDSFFSILKENNVKFYDSERQVNPVSIGESTGDDFDNTFDNILDSDEYEEEMLRQVHDFGGFY